MCIRDSTWSFLRKTLTRDTCTEMDRYVSPALAMPLAAEHSDYDRVDLELHGVDHSGGSFSVRVFVDDPQATQETAIEGNSAYAGSFYVFGHGPCLGDEGHCEVPSGPVSAYDFRAPHALTPLYRRLPITEAVRGRTGDDSTFTVTLVPVTNVAGEAQSADALFFQRLSIVAYS